MKATIINPSFSSFRIAWPAHVPVPCEEELGASGHLTVLLLPLLISSLTLFCGTGSKVHLGLFKQKNMQVLFWYLVSSMIRLTNVLGSPNNQCIQNFQMLCGILHLVSSVLISHLLKGGTNSNILRMDTRE